MLRVTRATWAAVALVLAAGAAACSSDDEASGGDPPGEAAAVEVTAADGPFATGWRTLELVDETRTTDAVPGRQPELPERTIEVEVVYPAEGEPAPEPTGEAFAEAAASTEDAPPAEGAFPLVVFGHGFGGRADHFRGLAERWAREGYVVALPWFPLSREGVSVFDLAAQPGDVSFVIDELTALPEDDPLAGHVDGERIAVGGHSLGAATTFAVAYNSCCRDDRIDATITVAGGTLPMEGGDYEDPPEVPMLLVHGARDQVVPVDVGDAMFDIFDPVWYLRPAEADHVTVFVGEEGRLFADAAVAFLDAHLEGDEAALEAFADEVAASGVAEWRTGP